MSRSTGIVVFLTALGIFVAVTAILCYGIGKVINAEMNKEDGPNTKWTKTVWMSPAWQPAFEPGVAEQDGGADAAVSPRRGCRPMTATRM